MIHSQLAALKLTDVFMLPFIGISKFTVQEWLVETWIHSDKQHVVVEMVCKVPTFRVGQYHYINGRHLYKVKIPVHMIPDVDKFIAGQYSQISDHARKLLIELSGLPYNIPNPNNPNIIEHSPVLIAVHSDDDLSMAPWKQALRRTIADDLGMRYDDASELKELLTAPVLREDVFWTEVEP